MWQSCPDIKYSDSFTYQLQKAVSDKEEKEAATEEGIDMDLDEMMAALRVGDASSASPNSPATTTPPSTALILDEGKNLHIFQPESSGECMAF